MKDDKWELLKDYPGLEAGTIGVEDDEGRVFVSIKGEWFPVGFLSKHPDFFRKVEVEPEPAFEDVEIIVHPSSGFLSCMVPIWCSEEAGGVSVLSDLPCIPEYDGLVYLERGKKVLSASPRMYASANGYLTSWSDSGTTVLPIAARFGRRG